MKTVILAAVFATIAGASMASAAQPSQQGGHIVRVTKDSSNPYLGICRTGFEFNCPSAN
jgi:ABC-type sugar transport system substrate-binding protein